MSVLTTERLLIRPFVDDDVDELYRLVYADHKVRDAWSGYRETVEQFRMRFRAAKVWHAEDGFGFRALELKHDRALIGLMGLQKYEPGEDTSFIVFADGISGVGQNPRRIEVELTYALGRFYWNQGYATEAGRAIIGEGFGKLGVARIVNAVDPRNNNTINLMKRLSFRIEANHSPQGLRDFGAPGVIGILDNPANDEIRD
jgi:ribosomal-protein-alanine N-acetyltransferase